MKNIILITLAFVLSQAIFGQSIMPTYTDNPSWIVAYSSWGQCNLQLIKTDAPISICSKSYYPVLRCKLDGSNCKVIGYYRIEGSKVYMRKDPLIGGGLDCAYPEQLGYDFNLALADTVFCSSMSNDSLKLWNVSQSLVPYQGITRLTLWMQSTWGPMKWIKDIGSNMHPFFSLICINPVCENDNKLISAKINGIVTYLDNSFDPYFPCGKDVGINSNNFQESIKIYPLVTTGIVNLDNVVEKSLYQIVNITGQLIQTGILYQGNNSINIGNFSSGIYFIKLKNPELEFVQKLIKE